MNTEDKSTQDNSTYQSELTNIAKNAGVGGSGILIGNLILYLSSILIARSVGAEYYGLYYLGMNIVNVAGLLVSFGMSSGILRFVSMYMGRHDYERIKGTAFFGIKYSLWAGTVAGITIFLAAQFFSKSFFQKQELDLALKILCIGIPFSLVSATMLAVLQGLRLIKYSVIVNNISFPLFRLLLLVVLFSYGIYYLGVLLAQLIAIILVFIISAYFFFSKLPFLKKPGLFDQRSDFFHFTKFIYLQQFFNQAITALPIFILSYYYASSDVGIYGVGLRLSLMVSLPLIASNMIFAPTISMLYSKGERVTLEKLFKSTTKWVFTLSLFIFLAIILFTESILLVFGKDFVAGKEAVWFITCGELVNAGAGSVGYMLMMTGRSKINLLNSILLFCTMTIACFLFIPKYGIIGAGLGTAISVGLINIISIIEVYYFEKIHPYKSNFIKPLISGIFTLIIIAGLKDIYPIENIPVFVLFSIAYTLLFLLGLYVLKLDEEDIMIIQTIRRKFNF